MGTDPLAGFMAVLEATQDRLRSYVAGMGVPLADVDDLAQEVYLVFYREQDRRPPDVEPLAWLRGIARHRCGDYFRARGRAQRHWEEIGRLLEEQASPLERAPSDEPLLAALGRCLEKLPERYQQMLRWYYQEDASADEIGRRLRRSAGAIRVAILRLRQTLRACLAENAAEERAP
jgi:RNA polymerase sigma-70 factor (ECF subfamily)